MRMSPDQSSAYRRKSVCAVHKWQVGARLNRWRARPAPGHVWPRLFLVSWQNKMGEFRQGKEEAEVLRRARVRLPLYGWSLHLRALRQAVHGRAAQQLLVVVGIGVCGSSRGCLFLFARCTGRQGRGGQRSAEAAQGSSLLQDTSCSSPMWHKEAGRSWELHADCFPPALRCKVDHAHQPSAVRSPKEQAGAEVRTGGSGGRLRLRRSAMPATGPATEGELAKKLEVYGLAVGWGAALQARGSGPGRGGESMPMQVQAGLACSVQKARMGRQPALQPLAPAHALPGGSGPAAAGLHSRCKQAGASRGGKLAPWGAACPPGCALKAHAAHVLTQSLGGRVK